MVQALLASIPATIGAVNSPGRTYFLTYLSHLLKMSKYGSFSYIVHNLVSLRISNVSP